MKKIMFSLLAVSMWLSSWQVVQADPPLACCDVIQIAASQVEDCSAKGEFQPVLVSPSETASVTLQFDTSLAGTAVVVQALDGGVLGINGSATITKTETFLSHS